MDSELMELSGDITIITAEINSYKNVASQAVFEIGKRLVHVKENDLTHGEFGLWLENNVEMSWQTANKFMRAYSQYGDYATSRNLPTSKIFELLTLPTQIDRQDFLNAKHILPSTGESKAVSEMTIRELREVKKALKEAEQKCELAEKDARILRDTLESIEDKEPEIRTEYVEVTDESSEQKLRKYEELFGDVSMYEGKTTRVTNGDAITYSVFEFTEDVRKFVEKYGHLTHFAKEFNGMIGEGKAEYSNAIQSMFSLLKSIERNLDESEVIIINQ